MVNSAYYSTQVRIDHGSIVSRQKDTKSVKGVLILTLDLRNPDIDVLVYKIWTAINDKLNSSNPLTLAEFQSVRLKLSTCDQIITQDFLRSRKRGRRSLFDFGGQILKKVVGTATTKDVIDLETNIHVQIEKHALKLDQLQTYSRQSKDVLNRMQRFLEKSAHLDDERFLQNLKQDVLYRVRAICDAFNLIRMDMEMNHLHLNLIGKAQVDKLISDYSYKWNLRPLIDINDANFEKSVTTKVIKINETRTALISIPFFDDRTYATYRIQSFPMFTNVSTSNKFKLQIDYQYVLVSNDHLEIGLLNNNFFKGCLKIVNDFVVCPNFPLRRRSIALDSVCETNLILNNDSSTCVFKHTDPNDFSYVQIGDLSVVSTIPGTKVTSYCTNNITTKTLPNSGIGVFSSFCTLESSQFRLIATKSKSISVPYFFPKNFSNNFIYVGNAHNAQKALNELNNSIVNLNAVRIDNLESNKVVLMIFIPISTLLIVGLTTTIAIILVYRKWFAHNGV